MPEMSEGAWRSAAAIAVSAVVVGIVAGMLVDPVAELLLVLRQFRWQSLSIGKRGDGGNWQFDLKRAKAIKMEAHALRSIRIREYPAC